MAPRPAPSPPPAPPRAPPPTGAPTATAATAAAAPHPPRVVLVDDQLGMRTAVERYLAERGFEVESHGGAAEALAALGAAPPPAAIVTDVLMPGGLDGLALLRAVRADARLCAVPVVLLTAKGLTPDRIAGYEAGASAYVSKPFDPDELVAVLHSAVANSLLAKAGSADAAISELRQDVADMKQLLQLVLQLQSAGTPQLAPPSPLVRAPAGTPAQLGAAPGVLTVQVAPAAAAAGAAAPAPQLGYYASPRAPAAGGAGTEPAVHLTPRERKVLELVGEGMLNKEIAAELGVGQRYVEKVVKRLLEKTATPNRTTLVRRALQTGLLVDSAIGAATAAANAPVFIIQPVAPPGPS